jgi:hypothetical protein
LEALDPVGPWVRYRTFNSSDLVQRIYFTGRDTIGPMTASDFRRLALALPEATEGSHFNQADFRIANRIFATLSLEKQGYGVLLLTPDQQAGMVQDAAGIFTPVPGGWGRKGSTRVHLASVTEDILAAALRTAWQNRAAAKGSLRRPSPPQPRGRRAPSDRHARKNPL